MYKIAKETSLTSEVAPEVDEVIGEYYDGVNLYYFARFMGGIAYKVGVFLSYLRVEQVL